MKIIRETKKPRAPTPGAVKTKKDHLEKKKRKNKRRTRKQIREASIESEHVYTASSEKARILPGGTLSYTGGRAVEIVRTCTLHDRYLLLPLLLYRILLKVASSFTIIVFPRCSYPGFCVPKRNGP